MIYLYNTLTKKKEEFKPITAGTVGMYNCGPTVYKSAHIGNLRAYVFADILRRALEYSDYRVNQIINITDVGHLTSDADLGEDKLEKEARAKKINAQDIAEKYTQEYIRDLSDLNIEASQEFPAHFPKASLHIAEQIEVIQQLEKKNHTYRTTDGIYFDTKTFPGYGKLGGIDLAGLQEGARVEQNTEKKNPTDFALWKFSKPEEKRQQEWQSPWGIGFPGWHIECSAMSRKYLGQPFDIHTGGIDHIPVHHNNEIAQSECAYGNFVNLWMHSAFLTVSGGDKMAKSGDNFLTLQSIKDHGIHPLAYRYWLLTAHYRSPINFAWEAVEGAHVALERMVGEVSRLKKLAGAETGFPDTTYMKEFEEKINDDLDTASAIALLYTVVNSKLDPAHKLATIQEFDSVLGLKLSELAEEILTDIPTNIIALGTDRVSFRIAKDWKKSDDIRNEIEKLGFNVRDYPDGTSVIEKKLKMLI